MIHILNRIFLLSLFGFPSIALAGYDLHITRANEWTLSSKKPISERELKAAVASDAELKMDTTASAENPITRERIQVTNRLMASWIDPTTKEKHYFYYFRGEIIVKNPSENTIAKMKAVAKKLSARVQGDDGEWY
ncbi:hypothetical protein RF679_07050 [Undibacterium cyanobacteriorum]|uniref:Uncharacterized protein n=1 Tax=Undibacterium cyanobacteriorum TaxID=3073561 RepID=A0ABY9RLF4_9BURK|nr:hypothetical protein [Undibacterium sp. 20NA77.5]WMW82037.1 hypothetical protein RF679_07050 [Undibacterium sp. 20NA77.5]